MSTNQEGKHTPEQHVATREDIRHAFNNYIKDRGRYGANDITLFEAGVLYSEATLSTREKNVRERIELEHSLTEREAEITQLKDTITAHEWTNEVHSGFIKDLLGDHSQYPPMLAIKDAVVARVKTIEAKDKELDQLRKDLREIQKSNAKIQILIVESDIDYEIMLTSEEVQRQSKLISEALSKSKPTE